jgi:hypothetical protein
MVRMAVIGKTDNKNKYWKRYGETGTHMFLMGMYSYTASLENSLEVSLKVKHKFTI